MYGMVNQAIKGLVTSKFGDAAWIKICSEAKLSPADFDYMEYYPDKITYDLVGAASKELGLPGEVILTEFGKYWVLYTAQEGYGPMMDMFGVDFMSCLANLNNLHSRMGMTMPHLTPPKFEYTKIDDNTCHLKYESKRPGLSPMVKGLIEGLAAKYKVTVKIDFDENSATGEKIFKISQQSETQ